jgi:hypothetical protein
LREQGAELELREKEHAFVDLKVITKAERDRARKRLGL